MPNYHLTAVKSEEGFVFICPDCQVRGIAALGTDDAVGRHLLICPTCRTTLAAWFSSESRERGLAELAEKLQRSFARSPSENRGKIAEPISIPRLLQLVKAYLLLTAAPGPLWRHVGDGMEKMGAGRPQEALGG